MNLPIRGDSLVDFTCVRLTINYRPRPTQTRARGSQLRVRVIYAEGISEMCATSVKLVGNYKLGRSFPIFARILQSLIHLGVLSGTRC